MAFIRPAIRRGSVSCKCGGGLSPPLRDGANFVSPSEWLQVSRAIRRGLSQVSSGNTPEETFRHAPAGALYVSHPDGDTRLAQAGRPGGNHVGTSRQRVPPNGGAYERQRMLTNRAHWHQSLHTKAADGPRRARRLRLGKADWTNSENAYRHSLDESIPFKCDLIERLVPIILQDSPDFFN